MKERIIFLETRFFTRYKYFIKHFPILFRYNSFLSQYKYFESYSFLDKCKETRIDEPISCRLQKKKI